MHWQLPHLPSLVLDINSMLQIFFSTFGVTVCKNYLNLINLQFENLTLNRN